MERMLSMGEKREIAYGTRERNRAIIEAWLRKMPYRQIASQFNVSEARIADIICTYKVRAVRYGTK